jgi:putative spermidine/putrescine transport system ATP-binding protein
VYDRPRSPFVARFLGAANLLDGKLVGHTDAVMIRPEHCTLNPDAGGRWVWPGRVSGVTFLGADVIVDVACDNGVSLRVRTRAAAVAAGDRATVGLQQEKLWPIPGGRGA